MEIISKSYLLVCHAAAYAAISMQTAYLKAHYPLEFTAGLLTSVMDDSDKLMKYINSFKQKGIHVLPPDITKSQYAFSIEETSNGESIRFGLEAIKSVGKEVALSIPKEREKGAYFGIDDFVERHVDMNKGAFENLAKSGAFDSFGYTRHTLVEEIPHLISIKRKELKDKDENQLSLFDFGLETTHSQYKMNELPEYSFIQLCRYEKEATGMYISGHPSESVDALAKKNGAINICDVGAYSEVKISGVINKITRKTTKFNKPMMIMEVEDMTGSISVLLFDQAMQKYSNHLEENGLIFLKGKVRGEDDDISLILDEVCSLKDTPSIMWIGTNDTSLVNLENLATNFKNQNPGIGDYLYIASKTSRIKKNLGEFNVNHMTIEKAKILFGPENVKITKKKS